MDQINKVKSISIWIFFIPFLSVNTCLILVTQFHELFANRADILQWTFPYFDGGASISRTARPYPSWLVFKPSMFLTSFLLIKYWLYNKSIIEHFEKDHKYKNKIIFFGIASAIALTVHSIFLGIKFDNDLYKLFRRVIMLSFIIFEIVAQAYLVATLYSFKEKIKHQINLQFLKLKIILVTILIVVALISIPIISLPGNDFFGFNLKYFKHALEWDYFLGVITFYLLTYFMWKKN
jgi:hypothetical protein